ncbi:hypothetical protein COE25_19495 [Bacillus sp. AFS031507]|nr:hypothetical protein COE25_19495 [Bacillus sp. AFS031507]
MLKWIMYLSYIAKKTYFDSIPHDKLLELIKEEVVDGSVLALIVQFLKSGILENGIFYQNEKGSPQGGVISPLLESAVCYGS